MTAHPPTIAAAVFAHVDAWNAAVAEADPPAIFEVAGYILGRIDADLAAGGPLHDARDAIGSFADLHDHLDANGYVIDAEHALDLDDMHAERPEGFFALINAATAIVDTRLVMRAAQRAIAD